MDVLIVGAGVVGLAVADALAACGVDVVVVDRAAQIGTGISSRNSEVIHAGLYYPHGSLKARLCVQGRERLADFCARHGVAHRWTGKLVVASGPDDLPALDALQQKAAANGARPLLPLDAHEIVRRFPTVRAVAAMWSTGTGIVDSHGLMGKLRGQVQARGGEVLCRHNLRGADRTANGWRATIDQPDGSRVDCEFDAVVNAAGLYADSVARLACADADLPRHVLVKGCYFDIAGPTPADTLVYPVPSPTLVGLGTHLTIDLAGRARLGPDVQPAATRDDFTVDAATGDAFHAAATRFLPGLRREALHPAYAGIRPKLATDRVADFYVREESARGCPGWVNLCGIESPGLTAALAIGREVAVLLGAAPPEA